MKTIEKQARRLVAGDVISGEGTVESTSIERGQIFIRYEEGHSTLGSADDYVWVEVSDAYCGPQPQPEPEPVKGFYVILSDEELALYARRVLQQGVGAKFEVKPDLVLPVEVTKVSDGRIGDSGSVSVIARVTETISTKDGSYLDGEILYVGPAHNRSGFIVPERSIEENPDHPGWYTIRFDYSWVTN